MEMVEWNESYSVGVEELDEQHKRWFGIINALFEASDTTGRSQAVADLLSDMKECAAAHFETEERYMSECGFPDLESHVRAHEQFRKKLDELFSEKMAGRQCVATDTLEFLYEWLVDHVLSCDKKYAPLVSAHKG
ncbi:MAG: hemerythrin family protein [Planctomycetes bacterium]|nr:hemerythrin family protein [Planctomycetota bacterium]